METSKKRKRLPPPERVRPKKIGLLIGFGANYRPSSDFIRQAESGSIPQSGMFLHQIPVGHAGDVIAHRSVQPLALDPPSCRIPELTRIEKVAFESLSQHLTRALVYLRHPGMVIDIL